jgi:2,3,4,5-tetrahydropyridine-2-carboxylate N-succinyltransferase
MSSQSTAAHGHGIATLSGTTVLDVWFPAPAIGALVGKPAQSLLDAVGSDDVRKVRRVVVSREIVVTQPPEDAIDVYLRLHLL